MGPEATADLYLKIIRIFQARYGAKYDADYPEMFIYNLPLPDVVEKTSDVLQILLKALAKLQRAGCDFVIVPCNTATCILRGASIDLPIVDIISETVKFIKGRGFRKVGLLATKLTIRSRQYQRALGKENITTIEPTSDEQEQLTKIILNILCGVKSQEDKTVANKIMARMTAAGAEAIILGCTDLPLLVSQKESGIELIDTTAVLAEAAVQGARGETNA
jgi:aspartate racemase